MGSVDLQRNYTTLIGVDYLFFSLLIDQLSYMHSILHFKSVSHIARTAHQVVFPILLASLPDLTLLTDPTSHTAMHRNHRCTVQLTHHKSTHLSHSYTNMFAPLNAADC